MKRKGKGKASKRIDIATGKFHRGPSVVRRDNAKMTRFNELRNNAVAKATAAAAHAQLVIKVQNEVPVHSRVRHRSVISRVSREDPVRMEQAGKLWTTFSNMAVGEARSDKVDLESARSPLVLSFEWNPDVIQDGPNDTGESYNSTACSSNANGPHRVPTQMESEEYHRRIRRTLSHGVCPTLLLGADEDDDTSPASFGTSLAMRVDRGLSDMMRGNTLNAMIVRSLEFSHRSILAMVSTEWYAVAVPSSSPEHLNLDLVAANDTLVVDKEAAANVLLSGA